MRNATLVFFALCLTGLAGPVSARTPVVVELFTSQGCSSCVKSGDVAGKLADDPRVILLTFGVDYWDYLGWRDTFAKAEFTDRQRAYMQTMALRDVYTPQIIVAGATEVAAVHADAIEDMVAQAARARAYPPDLAVGKSRIAVGYGHAPKGGADVWLVRYDPGRSTVAVKQGENRGQTIVERNVVRELVRLGGWTGRPRVYRAPPAQSEGLQSVVVVQAAHGGPVLAAGKAPP
jgi:hypothetical protein